MTLKEKRLRILSLAMDINEKYGAICFVNYSPHVDLIEVRIYEKSWTSGGISKTYNVYGNDRVDREFNLISNYEMIAILQGILENGLK